MRDQTLARTGGDDRRNACGDHVMDDSLFPTRLKWDGRRGCARFAGDGGPIGAKPIVPGLPEWDNIDYVPGAVAALMPYAGPWRDLWPAEVAAIVRWLRVTVTESAGETL